MAKKQNGEDQAPEVRKAESLESKHQALQAERRAIEAELVDIDKRIRSAIHAGDAALLEQLNERKAKLPGLYILASTRETSLRNEIFNAQDAANAETLQSAIVERDELQETLAKRRRETEAEIAELKSRAQQAEQNVASLYANIGAARNFASSQDEAFKRSLAKLAGV